MQRERVSDNVYWFQSEIYAQVSAGVIAGPKWAVLVDTLMPQETLSIKEFIKGKLALPVKYIINTHHHADHCWGNCFFPGATIIGHELCRQYLADKAPSALEVASQENPLYAKLSIIPPQITFKDGTYGLKVGKKNIKLFPAPGHSNDGIAALIEEDRILFSGDVFMPIPFIVEGNLEQSIETTQEIAKMGLENIIQGHGDIILRGEIEEKARENITYLKAIQKAVRTARRRKNPIEVLDSIGIEACGKSRVLLGGLASELHRRNLRALYYQTIEQDNISEVGAEVI
ncbi:MAG: MBL fold metallo-hydrolase [Chloroflexota bacterium]|nr:MBL fold metallo-hydrolase [Chloroflexota bacterium]